MKPVKNYLECLCSVDKPIETSQNLIGDKDPIPEENIGDSILNALKSKPNFIGQVNAETEEQITFQQMRENSVKCALWLKKVGVKKGDVVTICTRNPSVVYMPFLASIYIGAIVNPWEEKYFRDMIRVMYFLVINEPDVIFVDRDNFTQLLLSIVILKSIKKVIKIVTIGGINNISIRLNSLETILNDDFDEAEIDQFSCEKNHMMDTAIRTFSSAATTYPGQVDVPYIAFTSPSNKQTPVMFPGAIGLWYGSLCWTHGPLLTVHAILSRVTAIKSAVLSEVNLYKTIGKYEVTWVFLESDVWNPLLLFHQNRGENLLSKYDVSTLKTILFDNWAIHKVVHEKLISSLPDVSVILVYSKPEIGVIAYQRDNDLTSGSAGCVAKNVQLSFINNDMEHSVADKGFMQAAKIYCKTPYITRCKHGAEQPWCFIGDRGFYSEEGDITVITDTVMQCIEYEGGQLFPRVVETTLQLHPAVSEVIVTAVRHPIDFLHLVAYVKTKPGEKVTAMKLQQLVKRTLFKLHEVRFITYDMPRLPNGKINREYFRLLNNWSL